MNQEKRNTVGYEAVRLFEKGEYVASPIDLREAGLRDYYQNLIDCALKHRKVFTGRFFIIVATKREPLLTNVIRNYFFARKTCPTPEYEQSVFRYDNIDEKIEYIWTVPDKETVHHLLLNAPFVVPAEQELLQMCKDFVSNKLLRKAKKYNQEKETSLELTKETIL